MESKRQLQLARMIKDIVGEIFIRQGVGIYGKAFVTITDVTITPDLQLARVYLSVYNVPDKGNVVGLITENKQSIRWQLGNKMRHKVRHIPELEFYLDETLDKALHMEKLLDDLMAEVPERGDEEEE